MGSRREPLAGALKSRIKGAFLCRLWEESFAKKNFSKRPRMQLKVILNAIEKHKGFIYSNVRWDKQYKEKQLLIDISFRAGSKGFCSGCGTKGPTYDTLPARLFQFVPLWGILVFFVYAMRRIDCKACGPTVEMVPWAQGKSPITKSLGWFLAGWAKRMSIEDVSRAFNVGWHGVFESIKMAVNWGLKNRDLSNIMAIGVDEIAWQKGHKYLTLVYQIDASCKRLLWVGENRSEETLKAFFRWFTKERTSQLTYICSDMWKPYISIIRGWAGDAVHILDRFHIMSHFGKAIDKVRAEEHRELKEQGKETLKHSRWCLLKRQENLTETQANKLSDLLRYNLRSVRAYLLKEDFQQLWTYSSPGWAKRFMDQWCRRAMKSRIDPIKDVAKMIRKHQDMILNWFHAKGTISAAVVEGLNNKCKVTIRKSYGFQTYEVQRIMLYHTIGALPEPVLAHKFF